MRGPAPYFNEHQKLVQVDRAWHAPAITSAKLGANLDARTHARKQESAH